MKKILFFVVLFVFIVPVAVYAQDNIQKLDMESTVSGRNQMQALDQIESTGQMPGIGYKQKASLLLPRLSALKLRIESITKRLDSRYEKIKQSSRGSDDFFNQNSEINKLTSALPEQELKTQNIQSLLLQSTNPKADYYQFRDQVMFYYQLEKQILKMQSDFIGQMSKN